MLKLREEIPRLCVTKTKTFCVALIALRYLVVTFELRAVIVVSFSINSLAQQLLILFIGDSPLSKSIL